MLGLAVGGKHWYRVPFVGWADPGARAVQDAARLPGDQGELQHMQAGAWAFWGWGLCGGAEPAAAAVRVDPSALVSAVHADGAVVAPGWNSRWL